MKQITPRDKQSLDFSNSPARLPLSYRTSSPVQSHTSFLLPGEKLQSNEGQKDSYRTPCTSTCLCTHDGTASRGKQSSFCPFTSSLPTSILSRPLRGWSSRKSLPMQSQPRRPLPPRSLKPRGPKRKLRSARTRKRPSKTRNPPLTPTKTGSQWSSLGSTSRRNPDCGLCLRVGV
jgi:hypothetical protein